MRTPFIHTLLLTCALAAAAAPQLRSEQPPHAPLASTLLAKQPSSLLPDDLAGSMDFRGGSTPPSTATWNTAEGALVRIETTQASGDPNSVSARWSFREPVKRGDVGLVRFYARAAYARQESGEAIIQLSVDQSEPAFARHVFVPLTAGPDWALLEVPFAFVSDASPNQGRIVLGFGTLAQAVEIAGLELLNFGKRATVAELPQTRFTYKGREPDAAWRRAALTRIHELRTAPMEIRVIDAAGQPVPDARIAVRLVRPAFLFGTEVNASLLLADSPDGATYREKLVELFDSAVLGNALKWPNWSASEQRRDEALRATDWLEANKLRMRGHNLVWPGDKFSPRRIVNLPPPRSELPLLIKEHIRDLMTATRGRIVAWDVVNELMHERDYFKYMPETEAVEWFKLAREIDPHAKLFLNDYAMLNSRRSPETIARFLDLTARLRAAGAPIDALGVQGHVGRQVRDPEDVLADLDLLAQSGLELQITEFDVNTPDEELQADYTRDFLIALYSHHAVTGFTKWGFWEKSHWKPDAAMFRADWSEKPNARVWRELVRGEWLTKVDLMTDARGEAGARGHLGDYEFTVTANGKTARQMRPLGQGGGRFVVQLP